MQIREQTRVTCPSPETGTPPATACLILGDCKPCVLFCYEKCLVKARTKSQGNPMTSVITLNWQPHFSLGLDTHQALMMSARDRSTQSPLIEVTR